MLLNCIVQVIGSPSGIAAVVSIMSWMGLSIIEYDTRCALCTFPIV